MLCVTCASLGLRGALLGFVLQPLGLRMRRSASARIRSSSRWISSTLA